MPKTKQMFFGKFSQQQLLLALFLIIAAGGLLYWRNYSSNPPKALESSANEETPHWYHTESPFKMVIYNYAGNQWDSYITKSGKNWEVSGAYGYSISKKLDKNFQCYPIVLPLQPGMNFCSMNEDNGFLALAGYGTGPDDPEHLTGGIVIVNDYYLSTLGSIYNTAVWKNYISCRFMGWTMGVPFQWNDGEPVDSCMGILSEDIISPKTMQYPNETDLQAAKVLYDHQDTGSAPMPMSAQKNLSKAFSAGELGPVVQSFSNGKIEIRKLDLGDGYSFNSIIQKK